ncbi:MAG: hypothetical protein ACYCU0_11255, partial [Solirubrobacteraceae bacterium]
MPTLDPQISNRHFLDPLTSQEISAGVAVLRADERFSEAMRFISMSTAEPAREAAERPRAAEVVLHDRA